MIKMAEALAREELDFLYSPSRHTKKMSPDIVVQNHIEVLEKGNKSHL